MIFVRKIHVCIAYKTYVAEKIIDLLHLQLIICMLRAILEAQVGRRSLATRTKKSLANRLKTH